jgi:hypothetical protein
MKIKIRSFNEITLKQKLENTLSYNNYSLFLDTIIESENELSDVNILVLQEPNEYFHFHDYAILNKNYFDIILTWSDRVLNNCENATYLPVGTTWMKEDQYNKNHEKKFQLTHLCGKLLKTYGHSLRHELIARRDEIKNIPLNFHDVYGDRYNIEEARIGKEELFAPSQYGVAIENINARGWFTEKILDCFLLKTIPIYWGCSNIGDFFNEKGIIHVENIDDMIYKLNNLEEQYGYYEDYKEVIEENYNLALQYVDYEQCIANELNKIFKYNNL